MLFRPGTVTAYQGMLFAIYGAYDDTHYSDEDLMFRLYESMAKCFETLRKEEYKAIVERIPHLLSWLCAICNRKKIDLAEAVWHKYPDICPYGMEMSGCICITREMSYAPSLPELSHLRNDRSHIPQTFREFQQMFARIYGPVNRVKSIVAVVCHLAEEVGEVGEAYRLGNKEEMREEIADVFAWLCGVATRLGANLEVAAWDAYPGVCNTCGEKVCACPAPCTMPIGRQAVKK